MTKKRVFSALLILSLILSLFTLTAAALEVRASKTLTYYNAITTQGSGTGKVKITYDVEATDEADKVGVSMIKVYREDDDTHVTTIKGTVANGLLIEKAHRHRSSYTYTGAPGTSYYAVVTVTATIGSDTDSRDITTNSIQAPYGS